MNNAELPPPRAIDWPALFSPRTVAVIGASDRAGSMQRRQYSRIRDNLTPRGVRVYPVNPAKAQVLGDRAYPSLASLPAPVDVAAVLLRDPIPAVEDCVAAGAKFAIVMSADFGDVENSQDDPSQRRLRALASGDTRVIGPNTAIQVFENWRRDLPGKRLAVVTHSGHLGRPIVQAETLGIPVEAWIALGNEVDVEWADAVHYFASVPSVGAIASYVEGFGDGRTLMSAADAAARAGVPLICVKVGRSEAGRSAALSHTGHLTGSDAVYDAVFWQYGVIRVDDIDELVEIAGLFCHARLSEASQPAGAGSAGAGSGRVAVYGLSGAVAAHAVDMCATAGLEVRPFTQPTTDAIAGLLPRFLRRDNPVDVGGVITLTADNVILMNLMRDDPNVDMLFVPIVGPEAPFTDAVARDAIELHRSGGKPVVVAWTSAARDCDSYRDLCAAGVPLFHSFGAAVRGMAELSRWTEFRAGYQTPVVAPLESGAEVADQARRLLAKGKVLNEVDSGRLLSLYGIPVVAGQVVTSARDAWRAARDQGAAAVVLKAVSAAISHKSDFGLVLTGLRGQSEVIDGYERLMARAREVVPAAQIDGVLVQPMIDGVVAEVMLGLSRQPPFGLTITYGFGGVLAELFGDVAHAVPPVDRRHVAAMIARTRSSALLRGFRGGQPGDVEALIDAILALQRLAVDLGEDIAELDINPLLVRAAGAGVVAVDALVVPAARSGQELPAWAWSVSRWPEFHPDEEEAEETLADLSLTPDQVTLRDAAADLFRKESPLSLVRTAEATGFDRDLWDLVFRAGFPTMGIDEGLGGAAATPIDLAVVAQEYGRALAPVPLIEAIVAGNLLSRAAPDSDLVTSVVNGESIPTLALLPVAGNVARMLPAGSLADIVIAYRDGSLLAFPPGADPVPGKLANLGDLPVADRRLSPDRAVTLATGDRAAALFHDARTEWKLLTAAALNGLRERALDIGVEYVKSRVAFGVPLGWFQAVQHRLADDAVAGDGGRLLMYEAAWARGERLGNADELVSMAFVYNAETAFRTCRSSLQFHGGYGFTLEYDIQLYFRRAKSWPLMLGAAHTEMDYLADQLLGPAKGTRHGL